MPATRSIRGSTADTSRSIREDLASCIKRHSKWIKGKIKIALNPIQSLNILIKKNRLK
jgi:hypothetical protein